LATKIINGFLKTYKTESEFTKLEGRILNIKETEEYFTKYLQELDVTDKVTLNFSQNSVRINSNCSGGSHKYDS
jgi:hypothetical protein